MNILDLPREIIKNILDHLLSNEQHFFCCTCKKANNLIHNVNTDMVIYVSTLLQNFHQWSFLARKKNVLVEYDRGNTVSLFALINAMKETQVKYNSRYHISITSDQERNIQILHFANHETDSYVSMCIYFRFDRALESYFRTRLLSEASKLLNKYSSQLIAANMYASINLLVSAAKIIYVRN